jgi:hypothetical protein
MKSNGMNDLRNMLGWLGILLPIADAFFNIVFGGSFNPPFILSSISATHYSSGYLLFEGLVFGVGLFLLTYKGYDITDYWMSTVAGAGAILLTLFPCSFPEGETRNFLMLPQSVTNIFHLAGAFLFFFFLAVIEFFQFTKTNGVETEGKKKRNILYRICAVVMLLSLILGFSLAKLVPNFHYWVYIAESIALWAFGLAWLVKGGAFLKDAENKTHT